MNIGKIKKGEQIIVMMVTDKLQSQFNELEKNREELKWMVDELAKLQKLNVEIPDEKLAALYKKKAQGDMLRIQFWTDVNDQYDLWHKGNIGIRDGYCLVECKKLPDPREFMGKLEKFIKDELGEDFELGGGPLPEED